MKLREGGVEGVESFGSCVPFVVFEAVQEVHHSSKECPDVLKRLMMIREKFTGERNRIANGIREY